MARLYMILSPRPKRSYRLIIIGEKHLPAVSGGGDRKSWGFVEKVASRPEEVEDELDPEVYDTKTPGERQLPPARPAGEGIYAIVRHSGHTHLAYALAHLSQLRSTEDFFVGQGLGKVSDFKGSEFESVCSVDQVSFQALQFAYNQTPRCTFDRTGELKMAKNIATGTS